MTYAKHSSARPSTRKVVLATTLIAASLLGPSSAAIGSVDPARYAFDVYFNGKRIGEHAFELNRADQALYVRSRANFTVKVLFVPVYKYRHEATETWRAGCLQSLDASTNDNGTRFAISVQPRPDILLLSRNSPTNAQIPLTDPCPATYAYWDRNLLESDRLINAQTGELDPARLLDRGPDELDGVAARRYTLVTKDGATIELWYRATDARWIGLETERAGGTLSYRLSS